MTRTGAPLLFIGGEKDHVMPPSANKSNARHYRDGPTVLIEVGGW